MPGHRAGQPYRHAAAVVGSSDEMLAVALPYLEEGLRAGELTVLTCPPDTLELLRRELGTAATSVLVDSSLSLIGARPPDVFTHVRDYVERARTEPGARLRVFAESVVEPGAQRWREEMRVDAVFNDVMATIPVTAVCLYDRRRMPAHVVDSAEQTHPQLLTAAGWLDSAAYQPASSFVRGLPVPREPMEDSRPVFSIDDASTLPDLRHQLGAALAEHVDDADLRDDLHLALSEVAANAFRHGTRPVSARLWTDGIGMVCTITDSGSTFDDPLAGFVPAHGYDLSRGGMGLWLARKLWDHVDLLSGQQGFTVRLSTSLRSATTP